MKRRTVIKAGIAGAGLGTLPLAGKPVLGETPPLVKTPRDAEGPYYPVENRDADTPDLLRDMTTPRGKILHFKGRVLRTDASPVAGAVLDIWHTDPQGRYKHPRDPAPGQRHADFAYFGVAQTDSDGRFAFRTYIPGPYNLRPSHIHYKVVEAGRTRLTSQVYFKGLDERSGAAIWSARHDLRKAELIPGDDGTWATDFRVVI